MSIFSFLISEFQPQESREKDLRTSDFCFMRHRIQLSVLPPWGLYQYFSLFVMCLSQEGCLCKCWKQIYLRLTKKSTNTVQDGDISHQIAAIARTETESNEPINTEYKQTQARDRSHQRATTSPQHTHGLAYLNLYQIRERSNVKRKHKQNSQVYKSRLLKLEIE